MANRKTSSAPVRKVKSADAPKESKREKFLRLGNARVATALKKISLIGNLSGPGYEFSEADVDKINNALADMVEKTMARFQPKVGGSSGPAFDLTA